MVALHSSVDKDQTVTALAAHPALPFYLSANTHGRIFLWHFGWNNALAEFTCSTNPGAAGSKASAGDQITR